MNENKVCEKCKAPLVDSDCEEWREFLDEITREENAAEESQSTPKMKGYDVSAVWTKRDGTKVLVRDMVDAHLMNTIRMLERKGFVPSLPIMPCCNGEMAQMAAEAEFDRACEKYAPIMGKLYAEAEYRGLL